VSLSSPERLRVLDTKLPTPLSNGLVAESDPALRQKIFHISEAQAESVVKPNSMTHNFMGESISAVTGQIGFHRLSLFGSRQLDNTHPVHGELIS
jgi:hypothetical protein